MGGHQVTAHGSGDDGFDDEGYDESQRAEILEATRAGPTDGAILTDVAPDLRETDDAPREDELSMEEGEVGALDSEATMSEEDMDEDDLQDDFDAGTVADDQELDDEDDAALRP